MALMEAELTEGTKRTAITDKVVYARVAEVPEQRVYSFDGGNGKSINMQLEVTRGDFAGRRIFFNNTFAGVFTYKKGQHAGEQGKFNPGTLYELVNCLGVEWECGGCKTVSNAKFVMDKGKFHCPSCGMHLIGFANPKGIQFDTDHMYGKEAVWKLTIRKVPNSDDEVNDVVGFSPVPQE
jgi:hypothetical protein